MQAKKVICDRGCQQEFELEMKTTCIRDDIEAVGCACPHCGEFYGYYQNAVIKQLQQEQQKLLKQRQILLNKGMNPKCKALQQIEKRIEDKKKEILAEMARLRTLVEGGVHAKSKMPALRANFVLC